jgi:hypothetical protein
LTARGEIGRLLLGAEDTAKPGGIGTVRFVVKCPGNAIDVLERAKKVLEKVLRARTDPWPSLDEWRRLLPSWFVERCAPEISQEEQEQRLRLPIEERQGLIEEEGWRLSAWLFWFQPDERQWAWWDAIVRDADTIIVAIEVDGWPFPWGSLKWLFLACSALSVEAEE